MSKSRGDQALRQALENTLGLLESVKEHNWSAHIREALHEEAIDPDEVLSWYGGMGSFNDLIIARTNGHRIEPGRESMVNTKLDGLRSSIYALARELKHC